MKRMLASLVVAGLAVAAFSSPSFAGANANAKIVLHRLAPTTKAACTRTATMPACPNIVTSGALYPVLNFVHVLVTDGFTDGSVNSGVAGVQFGIQYDGPGATDGLGLDIYGWFLCASLEFTSPAPIWPNSGGGNLITWDPGTRCQRTEPGGVGTGVTANAGYFYCAAYTPARFAITPRPVDAAAKVADCQGLEDIVEGGSEIRIPSHLGFLELGGGSGYNPCGLVTPTVNTTWSAIKTNQR